MYIGWQQRHRGLAVARRWSASRCRCVESPQILINEATGPTFSYSSLFRHHLMPPPLDAQPTAQVGPISRLRSKSLESVGSGGWGGVQALCQSSILPRQ